MIRRTTSDTNPGSSAVTVLPPRASQEQPKDATDQTALIIEPQQTSHPLNLTARQLLFFIYVNICTYNPSFLPD